jgi:hypothetical protein
MQRPGYTSLKKKEQSVGPGELIQATALHLHADGSSSALSEGQKRGSILSRRKTLKPPIMPDVEYICTWCWEVGLSHIL